MSVSYAESLDPRLLKQTDPVATSKASEPTLSYGSTPTNVNWSITDGQPTGAMNWSANSDSLLQLKKNNDVAVTAFEIKADPKAGTQNTMSAGDAPSSWVTWKTTETNITFSNTTNQGLVFAEHFKVNFASDDSQTQKTVNLNFNVDSSSGEDVSTLSGNGIALKGKLEIFGGERASGNKKKKVVAKFGGTLDGDLAIATNSLQVGERTASAEITFIKGSITGNVSSAGQMELILQDGDIGGVLSTSTLGISGASGATINLTLNKENASVGGFTSGGGQITANFTKGGSIKNNIEANGGGNKITFAQNKTAIIGTNSDNKIIGNNGVNAISATDLTINGKTFITGGEGDTDSGYEGKNLIEISGDATLADNLIIRAGNRGNANTEKQNIFKFGGSVNNNTLSIANLTTASVVVANPSTDSYKTKNILSFDALTNPTTVSVTTFNDSAFLGDYKTGNIYIGKQLTSGTASDKTLALKSDFEANWTSSNYQAEKITLNITDDIFSRRGKNYISVGTLRVAGHTSEDGGSNYTYANDTTTGAITSAGGSNFIKAISLTTTGNILSGDKSAYASQNVIVAENFSSSSTTITAGQSNGGYASKNLFDISEKAVFSSSNLAITATQLGNTQTDKNNIIKFGGSVSTSADSINNSLAMSDLTAVTLDGDQSALKKTMNILSFDNLQNATTLTITNINNKTTIGTNKTGYNFIGKALTQGNAINGALALVNTLSDTTWNSSTYQADKLTLNATNLYVSKGRNYINVGAINIQNIEADSSVSGEGRNNLASKIFQAGTISASNHGNNNIFISESGEVTGNIATSDFGKNNLTFVGTTNTFSMGDSSKISVTNGEGNNTFNIQENTKVTSNLTTERLDGSGKNIFNISNAKSLAFESSTKTATTLNTTSGETEIVFLGDSGSSTGTFGGNVATSGGSTTFKFSNDAGTYGIIGTLSTSGEGQNIIDVSTNNATISNDLTFSGSGVTGAGGNIINIGNGKSLILTDTNSPANTKTLTTTNGITKIVFLGDTSSSSGTFSGNVATSGGSTTFKFSNDNGIYGIRGTLSTSGSGQNIIDISSYDVTISNDLVFSGSGVTGEGGNIINISGGKTLTLDDSGAKSILTNGGISRINFNDNGGSLSGNISTSDGNTIITFKENAGITGTLDVSGSGSTSIIIEDGKTGSISEVVTANGTSLSADIGAGSTLALTSGLTTSAGETEVNFNGASGTLNGNVTTSNSATTTFDLGILDSESATAIVESTKTITNSANATNKFNINAKSTTLQYGANGLEFSVGNNIISFENTDGATLDWKNSAGSATQAISTTGGTTRIDFKQNGIITADDTKTSINTNGANAITEIHIANSKIGTLNGAIKSESNGANNVVFEGNNSGLILKESSTLTNVTNSGTGRGNAISFYHQGRSGTDFKTLSVGVKDATDKGISGNGLNFIVYAISNKPKETPSTPVKPIVRAGGGSATTSYADKVLIHSSSNAGASTHHLGVIFENGTVLDDISYTRGGSNNILIATVDDDSKVKFNKSEKTVLGFTIADVGYATEATDVDGNIGGSGYTSYFVGKISDIEVIAAEQEITATAFALNYDLYMANLNSLNKRMGELRENAHSQGVWARVFNGAQSNDFGLGSKSNYTTIQAGYDYAFGFEGANNYLGFALSYALSTSTSDKAFDAQGQQREIGNIYSNAVEVAVYNSYVSDIGWYNDTIAKFSYLMSSFDINNLNTGSTTKNDTNNFALTFGDEVGYVFKLGESKEWSITPQVEFTFGYFNQSDFKQTLQDSGAYLASTANAVLTLRSRVGSSFGYDFKNFTQESGFNASLYVGAFYEYDYVSGGGITMSTDQMSGVENALSDIKSDGRVVMNVGTNMTIKDNTRLYFDFEKSFAGNITTDYQVNFGVRYSFGESNGYTPMVEKAEFKAPLKVENKEETEAKENTEENQAQEGVEATEKSSNTEAKDTTKEKADKESADSKEVKTEEKAK